MVVWDSAVSHHSSAASLCSSGFANRDHKHLALVVDSFNSIVSPSERVTAASILASPKQQRALSKKIEDHQFSVLYEASPPADKARLLSTSDPHASSWLLVTVATGLDLHLDPNELHTAVKWWLGVDTAREISCSLCPDTALDRLGSRHLQTRGRRGLSSQSPERSSAGIQSSCLPGGEGGERQWSHI